MVGENENNGNARYLKSRKRNNDNEQNMELKEALTCSTPLESSKRRNKKEVAIFGNCSNYYGYRVGQDLDKDPRLQVMKGEWFEGKDCLDIGCNSGLITIAIGTQLSHNLTKAFGCRSILGVDIDGARVRDACWALRKVVKTSTHNTSADAELESLDASLTDISCTGGVFILEPQPGSSYYKNRLVSETTAANYKNIEIPPEDFQDILLDKIGFRRVENITSGLSGTKSGFDRPILAFWK